MKTAKRILGGILLGVVLAAVGDLVLTDTPAIEVFFWFGFTVCVVAVVALGIKWVAE